MKPISALLYEVSIEDIQRLPEGFQVLRYDVLYGNFALYVKGTDKFHKADRFKYFLLKEPPISFSGNQS